MTAMPDLLYDESEEDLRASLRALLSDVDRWPAALARIDGGEPYDAKLWRVLAGEMGLAGLLVPEGHGGAGAGHRVAALVLEELGRAVAPVPYLGSAVVATTALLTCGATDLLRPLAEGDAVAALAVPFSRSPYDRALYDRVAERDGGLHGTITSVADALPADILLVPAADGLWAVDAEAPGVTRTPVVSLDATRQLCDITLAGASGQRIAGAETGRVAVRAALTTGAALLASEQLGVASWCLETTVAYVKERRQFGRPVGSFQAVKHRLADVWVDVTQARAVARYAAASAGEPGGEAEVAAALAQAHCAPVAVHAAEECVQLHGGIGFTWEYPAHLYLKRAKAAAIAFGTPDRHRAALGQLVDLPAA
ncbi:acyl-CoA dehydrogenase family protein [Phytohabitans houttuyneae]|uniref:Acyl-CoA dehydrogenase n=1 Tax=Phytohabitans houttuyneae TaxID=1076126 RepID=A0A6V8KZ99_9ACTN|nr:acyl-CoA dehydrogenase family protein [Phytohabitans houttuyneae]GFJ85855.1 acyl-CoA dehydrogenase [Phytohabitans houttuyneae]